MQRDQRILPKRYISVSFLDKNKGQVLVSNVKEIRDNTSVIILPSVIE